MDFVKKTSNQKECGHVFYERKSFVPYSVSSGAHENARASGFSLISLCRLQKAGTEALDLSREAVLGWRYT